MRNSKYFNAFLLVSFLSIIFISHNNCYSQGATPVYFDSNEKILTIDKQFNDAYKIFDNPGFQEARANSISGKFVVSIVVKNAGVLKTIKEDYSDKEFKLLRKLIDAKLESTSPLIKSKSGLNQEGKTFMITGGIVMSLLPYGIAIPTALGVEDDSGIAAGYLITTACGIFGTIAIANNSQVTVGQAYLYNHGLLMGFMHGGYLYSALTNNNRSANSNSAALGFASVLGIGEALIGYHLADNLKMRDAVGGNIFFMSMLGGANGIVMAESFDGNNNQERSVLFLLGSATGMVVGGLMTSDYYSNGDPIVVFSTALVGGYAVPALYSALSGDDMDGSIMPLLGTVAGAVIADRFMIQNHNFNTGDGLLCFVGTIGGFLGGTGLAIAFEADNNGFYVLSSIGAIGGLTGMYYAGRKGLSESLGLDKIQMDLNPSGFFADKMQNSITDPKYQHVFQLSYEF
jgi:hypothetical protein